MVKPQRFPWWLTASLVVALLVVVGILYPSTINSTLGDADENLSRIITIRDRFSSASPICDFNPLKSKDDYDLMIDTFAGSDNV